MLQVCRDMQCRHMQLNVEQVFVLKRMRAIRSHAWTVRCVNVQVGDSTCLLASACTCAIGYGAEVRRTQEWQEELPCNAQHFNALLDLTSMYMKRVFHFQAQLSSCAPRFQTGDNLQW